MDEPPIEVPSIPCGMPYFEEPPTWPPEPPSSVAEFVPEPPAIKVPAEVSVCFSVPTMATDALAVLKLCQYVTDTAGFDQTAYLLACREKYLQFLKLLAKQTAGCKSSEDAAKIQLVPTPDVDVWWQAHLIRPAQYRKFCQAQFGRILDRQDCQPWYAQGKFKSEDKDLETAFQATQKLWQKEYKSLYSELVYNDKESKNDAKEKVMENVPAVSELIQDRKWLGYLKQYAKKQDIFGAEFLANSWSAYTKFIFLCHKFPDEVALFLHPPYTADLFWHTHQMHPLAYEKDCGKIGKGGILVHEPWPKSTAEQDREKQIKSNKLWAEQFNETIWEGLDKAKS